MELVYGIVLEGRHLIQVITTSSFSLKLEKSYVHNAVLRSKYADGIMANR